jgi:hypothetical protein
MSTHKNNDEAEQLAEKAEALEKAALDSQPVPRGKVPASLQPVSQMKAEMDVGPEEVTEESEGDESKMKVPPVTESSC